MPCQLNEFSSLHDDGASECFTAPQVSVVNWAGRNDKNPNRHPAAVKELHDV